jgi:thioredoxin reductase/Pyruvate/2-oxoacid:ferredoxin oxidoreductase delta subunit
MLLTTLGFFLITALAIWWHVRASDARGAPAPKPAPCPRCRAPVPAGTALCPSCGAPQQAFEMFRAPLARAEMESGGDPKALVRADMCVGCGTCAASCPEPGAITLRGKLAVVDDALCKGHGECVRGCPVGAILVTRGAAVNRVTVPMLDEHFQTNVPGLYIVGELGGRGLIKNAINEGKLAVEHVTRTLGREATPTGDDLLDVVIVGSGPAGLSAGLEALHAGLRYVVLEQGSLSDTVRKYPRHKLLLAEPVRVPMYGDLWVADGSKETLLQVWETIVANTGLDVRTGQKVQHVARDDGRFRVQTVNAAYTARRVVLAMGRRGSPRRLAVPGEGLDHVFYDIVEMEAFAGRRVVVVGGGDSAVESALGLANQPATSVAISYRGGTFQRIAERNRGKIERAIAAGTVTPYFDSHVREIREEMVVLERGGESLLLPADYVVIRIGGEAPHAFLERLGVRIVDKDVPIPQQQARAG